MLLYLWLRNCLLIYNRGYQLVFNHKTQFWACNNLFGNINLIGKKWGFYKLLAWPISVVTIYFFNCFGHIFTRAKSMQSFRRLSVVEILVALNFKYCCISYTVTVYFTRVFLNFISFVGQTMHSALFLENVKSQFFVF